MAEFFWPVRVYYEDTDAGGVVYYANYLKFMERARTEWLRELGFEQDRMREEHGVIFAVRSVQIEYVQPARFNDRLEVGVRVTEVGGASLSFHQRVRRDEGDILVCRGDVKIACLDAARLRPRPIPDPLIAELPGAGC